MDTGSCKTIIDTKLCELAGIKYRPANGADCGTYSVPGTGSTNRYAGIVDQDLEVRFGGEVVYLLRGMRVINHPHPLLLVGADVLCGGRKAPMWNFNRVH